MSDSRSTVLAAGFWSSLPLDYFIRITGNSDLHAGTAKTLPFGSHDHSLASALLLRTMRLNCLTTAYADLWTEVYDSAWRSDGWVCDWPGLASLGGVGPTWNRDTPLRTERARRSALVEIDALVAVWLGMDVEALIAIYQAAFPVLNRYEEITWFDAGGWKLAGYHRTYGQIQQKTSHDEFLAYTRTRRRTRRRTATRRPSTRRIGSRSTGRRMRYSASGCGRRRGRVACGETYPGGGRTEDEPHPVPLYHVRAGGPSGAGGPGEVPKPPGQRDLPRAIPADPDTVPARRRWLAGHP